MKVFTIVVIDCDRRQVWFINIQEQSFLITSGVRKSGAVLPSLFLHAKL